MYQQPPRCRIILFGLEKPLAEELAIVLRAQRQDVVAAPLLSPRQCLGEVRRVGADLVFCPASRDCYVALLEAAAQDGLSLPVVVVSRTPEVSEWLDAIEAGASDYCAAPFESSHIQWILETTLGRQGSPALYRTA